MFLNVQGGDNDGMKYLTRPISDLDHAGWEVRFAAEHNPLMSDDYSATFRAISWLSHQSTMASECSAMRCNVKLESNIVILTFLAMNIAFGAALLQVREQALHHQHSLNYAQAWQCTA